MLSDLQRLEHPVLIVAGERERVVLCHAMKGFGATVRRKRTEMNQSEV